MYKDLIEANIVNTAAIGISVSDINGILTAIVLITAALYNIKKLSHEKKD